MGDWESHGSCIHARKVDCLNESLGGWHLGWTATERLWDAEVGTLGACLIGWMYGRLLGV